MPQTAPLDPAEATPFALPHALPRAILCDLDGCLISGDRVLPGAVAFVARHAARLWIVSNNSTDTAETLSARLAGLGLAVEPGRILLAGEAALERIAAERPGARVAFFAAASLRARGRALGISEAGEAGAPEAILLARDTGFDYEALRRLAVLAGAGVPLYVANPDAAHPGPDGGPVPETGALLAALCAVVPGLAFEMVGKPAPFLFDLALARAGVAAEEAVLVGDNPETDGAGAARAGIAFLRVPPGAGPDAIAGALP